MDTSDPEITFDDQGFCNHCRDYYIRANSELLLDSDRDTKFQDIISKIKRDGKDNEYDCVVGISGGIDSAMVAHIAKTNGLRPLVIHMDNGWNSELAVANIEKMLKKLELDLYTHVIDWEAFRDIHLAFLKASVANSEVPTDHAILASICRIASQRGIKYILSGSNIVTEAILPDSWHRSHEAQDWKYIKAIHKRFGTRSLENYPFFTPWKFAYWFFVKRLKFVSILNYFAYDKQAAIEMLKEKYDWVYYGGKHYESIYTRFFQAYILPQKFKIDKRRAHLSTLICSEQITRNKALEQMDLDLYSPEKLREDKEFVLKKFELSGSEFEDIMSQPIRSYKDFPASNFLLYKMPSLLRFVKQFVKP